MPRKDTRPVNTNVTEAQLEIVKELARTEGGIAQYIRFLIKRDAERKGHQWPVHPGRGKYPRKGVE